MAAHPIVFQPDPNAHPRKWHAKAIEMHMAGKGRREIALELNMSLSSISYFFLPKVRENRAWRLSKRSASASSRSELRGSVEDAQ